MAVEIASDERGTLLVMHFFNAVSAEQVIDAGARSVELIARDKPYQALLIFDSSVDVSDLDAEAINFIRENRIKELRDHGLQRQGGVAVVDASLHADIVMRLWNALSQGHPETTMPFEIFRDLEPALARLGVSPEVARPVISRTGRPS